MIEAKRPQLSEFLSVATCHRLQMMRTSCRGRGEGGWGLHPSDAGCAQRGRHQVRAEGDREAHLVDGEEGNEGRVPPAVAEEPSGGGAKGRGERQGWVDRKANQSALGESAEGTAGARPHTHKHTHHMKLMKPKWLRKKTARGAQLRTDEAWVTQMVTQAEVIRCAGTALPVRIGGSSGCNVVPAQRQRRS